MIQKTTKIYECSSSNTKWSEKTRIFLADITWWIIYDRSILSNLIEDLANNRRYYKINKKKYEEDQKIMKTFFS